MSKELPAGDHDPVTPGASPLARIGETHPHTPSFLQQLYQCAAIVGLAIASYLFISHFVVQSVQVVGKSMVPTLHNADRYFLNRWVYHFREPQRNDVVVLKDPTDGTYAVKRIVAVSGESIYLKEGQVFVDGQKLKEPYLEPGTFTYTTSALKEQMVTCGRNRYFVMGDNRNNSLDSRVYGPIPRENILGVIIR